MSEGLSEKRKSHVITREGMEEDGPASWRGGLHFHLREASMASTFWKLWRNLDEVR